MSAQFSPEYRPTNVVPFPGIGTTAGLTVGSTPGVPTSHDQLERLVAMMEALSFQVLAEKQIKAGTSAFDAVYLSSLSPDPISALSIDHLRRYVRIEDRSDLIGFDDGVD